MMFIRQGATHKVVLGPAVAVGDGFTPVTTLALSSADEAEAILHDNGTVVDISGYTWAAITTADGYYHLTLQSGISNTVGHMTIVVNDDSLCLPLRADFTVVEEAVYDALYAASAPGYVANAPVNVAQVSGDSTAADTLELFAEALDQATGQVDNGTFAAGAIDATAIAASALDNKGNWNVGKTGYTLTATTGLGNQTADITGSLSGSVGSVTGAVGSVTGAVGSVTGNVGGNVTGSVGSIASDGISRASFAAETGLQTIRSGTAQAGGSSTITLDASASATNDVYVPATLLITGGTGAGQHALIQSYVGATKVATLHAAWKTNPDNTSTFAILPHGMADVHLINSQTVTAAAPITVGAYVGGTGAAALETTAQSILTDTAEIGAAGAGLSAIPWNAAWDTEVQSEVADGLTAFAWSGITVGTVTTLTNLPAITSNWLTAAGLATDAVTEITSAVLTTAMTESYRGTGATATLAQACYEIIAHLGESAIVSTTKTLKKLDGSTTAKTYTLDDASTPTSITEAT